MLVSNTRCESKGGSNTGFLCPAFLCPILKPCLFEIANRPNKTWVDAFGDSDQAGVEENGELARFDGERPFDLESVVKPFGFFSSHLQGRETGDRQFRRL